MARVLIIERVASVREALALVLEMDGHTAATASSGEEALARAMLWRPDVVLADADMQDLTLSAFCSTMRAFDPSIAVVVTSMRPAYCTNVSACPDATFLGKPFTPAELDAVVGRLALRQQRGLTFSDCRNCA
jgi:two-component system nitrogen regulation response regulator NtrX